jgi:tetratricopeptide (TPR) repeat protein
MNRKERRRTAKFGQASSNLSGIAATAAAATGVAGLLGAGLIHHEAGRLAEAEACYRRVLAVQPDQADALHLLGVLARQLRRADVAVELIGQAIRRNGQNPVYFFNRGLALQELRRLDEALASHDKALALKPDYVEALYSRGSLLHEMKRLGEALASFNKVVALKPDYVEALVYRGCALLGAEAVRRGSGEL